MITIFKNGKPVRHVQCPEDMYEIQCQEGETYVEGIVEIPEDTSYKEMLPYKLMMINREYEEAVNSLKDLFKYSYLITPNKYEAKLFFGVSCIEDIKKLQKPQTNILFKNMIESQDKTVDVLLTKDSLAGGFTLKGKSTEINFDTANENVYQVDISASKSGCVPKYKSVTKKETEAFPEEEYFFDFETNEEVIPSRTTRLQQDKHSIWHTLPYRQITFYSGLSFTLLGIVLLIVQYLL